MLVMTVKLCHLSYVKYLDGVLESYLLKSLMHDWYVSSTPVEEPTSRLIGTCFMEDLAYMYEFIILWYWCMVVYMFWYTHIWHMLDDTMLLVLLD
jgi:hypothetical protein